MNVNMHTKAKLLLRRYTVCKILNLKQEVGIAIKSKKTST